MKEVDCSSNTTEAEPSGGGGGTLDFWKDWPPYPDDFIVPGRLYEAVGDWVFFIELSTITENFARLGGERFCDSSELVENGEFIFLAVSPVRCFEIPGSTEKCWAFKALRGEVLLYVLVDFEFCVGKHNPEETSQLRGSINSSIAPLDEP